MKKVILIVFIVLSIQVKGQEHRRDNKRTQIMSQISAEDIATIKTKKMTLFLDLNETQQRDIQKINLKKVKARKTQIEARKNKKERGLIEKRSAQDRFDKINKSLDDRIETKAKMKKILNNEQYSKWEKVLEKRHKKRRGERKPHRGNHKK